MAHQPKVPLVAAIEALSHKSYDSILEWYDSLTPAEQLTQQDLYVENNMGYGPEAWAAYLEAEAEQMEAHPGMRAMEMLQTAAQRSGVVFAHLEAIAEEASCSADETESEDAVLTVNAVVRMLSACGYALVAVPKYQIPSNGLKLTADERDDLALAEDLRQRAEGLKKDAERRRL